MSTSNEQAGSTNQPTSMILQIIIKVVGVLGGILIIGGMVLAFFPGLVGNHTISFGEWKLETDQIGFAMAAIGTLFVGVMLTKTLNVLVKVKSAVGQVSKRWSGKSVNASSKA